jgi:hypothetical protein
MKSLIGTTALVLLFSPILMGPVWAALGQTAASVERDRVMMKGQRQSRNAAGFSIDTITVAGIQVKEYVSSDGVVFAIVWTGTGVPDLQLLLGEYFEEYRQGVNAARSRRPKIRKPFQLKSERLVVERAGHSRSLWGRAFLPAALPPGVTAEDIQ